jgi:hypothetical protein
MSAAGAAAADSLSARSAGETPGFSRAGWMQCMAFYFQ